MLQITEQQAVAGLGSRWPTATPARRPSRDSPIRFKSYKELQISALGRKCVRIPAPNLAQKPLQEKGFPHYAMHWTGYGGGRAGSDASRRRFWAMGSRKQTRPGYLVGPRSRSRPGL